MRVELCPVYIHIPDYVACARHVPEDDLRGLYHRLFVEPYWVRCTDGLDHLGARYARESTRRCVTDLDAFARFGEALEGGDFGNLVVKVLQDCDARLFGPDTTAYLMAQNPRNTVFQREGWQGSGVCAGAGKLWLYVAPVGNWAAQVPFLVAHEYHHSVWTHRHNPDPTFNLLEYIVFEGRANVFADLVSAGVRPAFLQELDEDMLRRAWREMQPHLHERDPAVQQAFIFGDESRGIPSLGGYMVGYALVQSFLARHPGMSVDEWTALDAALLAGDSGYGFS